MYSSDHSADWPCSDQTRANGQKGIALEILTTTPDIQRHRRRLAGRFPGHVSSFFNELSTCRKGSPVSFQRQSSASRIGRPLDTFGFHFEPSGQYNRVRDSFFITFWFIFPDPSSILLEYLQSTS